MKITLAGFNIDTEIMREKQGFFFFFRNLFHEQIFTPETISAAYARISRSEKSLGELRIEARGNVEKARRSNQNIVFEMNHASVAEHAYFNFDVEEISRLALEWLEESRLCSFTEKSQRYVNFSQSGYVLPAEICCSPFRREFEELEEKKFILYEKATAKLKDFFAGRKEKAEEDARYILGLATESQVGFSANARNLEHLIRKLNVHPLAEARELGNKLYTRASKIAPSLIVMAKAEDFEKTYGQALKDDFLRDYSADLSAAVASVYGQKKIEGTAVKRVYLRDCSSHADERIIAAMLFRAGWPYEQAEKAVLISPDDDKKRFLTEALKNLSEYDALPREFENAEIAFEIVLSASAYAQLKRHRMSTQIIQPYSPEFGFVIPETVKEAGLEKDFKDLMYESIEFGKLLKNKQPGLEAYAYTNGHQKRVLLTANLRELYHFWRLRMDKHAQWEIREIAGEMLEQARNVAPIATLLACGKDQFSELKKRVYKN